MQTLWLLLAAGLMLAWLALAVIGPRKIETAGTLAVLGYGSVARPLALVFALAPAMIMVYAIWTFPWEGSESKRNLYGLLFLGASILGGFWLIEVTRVRVVVSEAGLTRYSPWSGVLTLKWIEVERVGYSAVNRWFTIEGARGTIRVSRHLGGIDAFVDAVRRHVAAERLAQAAAALDAVK